MNDFWQTIGKEWTTGTKTIQFVSLCSRHVNEWINTATRIRSYFLFLSPFNFLLDVKCYVNYKTTSSIKSPFLSNGIRPLDTCISIWMRKCVCLCVCVHVWSECRSVDTQLRFTLYKESIYLSSALFGKSHRPPPPHWNWCRYFVVFSCSACIFLSSTTVASFRWLLPMPRHTIVDTLGSCSHFTVDVCRCDRRHCAAVVAALHPLCN